MSPHGPIGQPAPRVMAVSRSSGETPASSSTRTQSFSSGMRTRLTTNPGVSLQRIGSLPTRSAKAKAASTGVERGELRADDLDQREDRRRVEEVHADDALRARHRVRDSVTESADVFVASTAPSATIALQLSEELALGVQILDDRLDDEVAPGQVRRARSWCSGERARRPALRRVSRAFSTPRPGSGRSASRARSLSSSLTSRPTVSMPACTHTCAIPAPMVPRPTTPTLRTPSLIRDGDCHLKANRLVGTAVLAFARRLAVRGDHGRSRPDAADDPLREARVLDVVHPGELDRVALDDRLFPQVLAREAQVRLLPWPERELLAGIRRDDRVARLGGRRAGLTGRHAGGRVVSAAGGGDGHHGEKHGEDASHVPYRLPEGGGRRRG